MILLLISIVLFLLYGSLILFYWRSWVAIPGFEPTKKTNGLKVSVVIPARNEEKNIGDLLEALQHQSYPREKYEVIVVDDHSDDNTARIVQQFPTVKLLSLEEDGINSYKKKAIEKGIAAANGEWIITTDADCLPGINWLSAFTEYKSGNSAVAIAAPVSIQCNNSILQVFQSLDMMVLQGITGAAISRKKLSLCNGANFAYEKKSFEEVNGFRGIDDIASGDDMLLFYKLETKFPGRSFYLKSKQAIISTEPMKTWGQFLNQRIRWASKARKYQDKRIFPILLLVYLFNALFLVLLVAGFFNNNYWWLLAGLVAAKTIIEFPFFVSLCRFFDKHWAIKLFVFFQPVHIIYTVIAGLFGQVGRYEWKGRRVR